MDTINNEIFNLRDKRERLVFIVVIFLLSLVASREFVLGISQIGGQDFFYHVGQIDSLKENLLNFDFSPIWDKTSSCGHLSPTRVQGVLVYYPIAILQIFLNKILGFSNVDSLSAAVRIAFVTVPFLSGLAMFILAYYLTRNKFAALIAAVAYQTSYLLLGQGLFLGSITKYSCFILFPVIIYFICRSFDEEQMIYSLCLSGFFLAVLISNHVASAGFFIVSFILLWISGVIFKRWDIRLSTKVFLAILGISLLLSAFFLIPALFERQNFNVHPENIFSKGLKFTVLNPLDFLNPRLGVLFSNRRSWLLPDVQNSYIGISLFILAILSFFSEGRKNRSFVYIITTIVIFFAFFMCAPSLNPGNYLGIEAFSAHRMISMLHFYLCILVMFGADYLIKFCYVKRKISLKTIYSISIFVLLVIFLDFIPIIFKHGHKKNFLNIDFIESSKESWDYIKKQDGNFRVSDHPWPSCMDHIYHGKDTLELWDNTTSKRDFLSYARGNLYSEFRTFLEKGDSGIIDRDAESVKFLKRFGLLNVKYMVVRKDDNCWIPHSSETFTVLDFKKSIIIINPFANWYFIPRKLFYIKGPNPSELFDTKICKSRYFDPWKTGFIYDNVIQVGGVIKSNATMDDIDRVLFENSAFKTDASNKMHLVSWTNGRIEIEADFAKRAYVILSMQYYPLWKIYIDGKEDSMYSAEAGLILFLVPRGKHSILFKITEPWYGMFAKYLSLCSILVIIFCFLYVRHRSRSQ